MNLDSDQDPEDLYELVYSLGEGSFGSVWKGIQKTTGAFCAIKAVPVDGEDIGDLKREIEILKKCNSEFVVSYFGSYMKDRYICIAMELCEAGSVSDLMHICDVHFEESVIKILCASVLLGLSYLHDIRIIHRDIKAGNVLLTQSGQAKLADFGVSAQLSTINAKGKTVIGTPFWMAPEVIQENQYDGKADIWSLGITLIELAEVEPPHSNVHPMRAIFMIPARPSPKFKEPSKWSSQMNDFLAKCLNKNPEQRPTSKALLSHPFVQQSVKELDNAKPIRGASQLLKATVEKYTPRMNEVRQEEMKQQLALAQQTAEKQRGTLPYDAKRDTMTQSLTATGTALLEGTLLKNALAANGTMQLGKSDTLTSFASTNAGTGQKANGGTGTSPAIPRLGGAGVAVQASSSSTATTTLTPVMNVNDIGKPGTMPADHASAVAIEEIQKIRARMRALDMQFRNDFKELTKQYDKRKT